jgi:hypothetical protein
MKLRKIFHLLPLRPGSTLILVSGMQKGGRGLPHRGLSRLKDLLHPYPVGGKQELQSAGEVFRKVSFRDFANPIAGDDESDEQGKGGFMAKDQDIVIVAELGEVREQIPERDAGFELFSGTGAVLPRPVGEEGPEPFRGRNGAVDVLSRVIGAGSREEEAAFIGGFAGEVYAASESMDEVPVSCMPLRMAMVVGEATRGIALSRSPMFPHGRGGRGRGAQRQYGAYERRQARHRPGSGRAGRWRAVG